MELTCESFWVPSRLLVWGARCRLGLVFLSSDGVGGQACVRDEVRGAKSLQAQCKSMGTQEPPPYPSLFLPRTGHCVPRYYPDSPKSGGVAGLLEVGMCFVQSSWVAGTGLLSSLRDRGRGTLPQSRIRYSSNVWSGLELLRCLEWVVFKKSAVTRVMSLCS